MEGVMGRGGGGKGEWAGVWGGGEGSTGFGKDEWPGLWRGYGMVSGLVVPGPVRARCSEAETSF